MSEVSYASAVGSCQTLSSGSCRYMNNPEKEHRRAVKWILRYLKGSSDILSDMALCYDDTDIRLHRNVDSNFEGK